MQTKLKFLTILVYFNVNAVDGNMALWKLVGLETKALAEIGAMLKVSKETLENMEKTYDKVDEQVNRVQYAYYLTNKIINIRENMVHIKNIQTLRDNIATGVQAKDDVVNFSNTELPLLKNFVLKAVGEDKGRKLRASELGRLEKEVAKSKASVINTLGSNARISALNASTNADALENDRNYYQFQYLKEMNRKDFEMYQEFRYAKFTNLIPQETPYAAYVKFRNSEAGR